jgi:hypothetical protein
MNEPKRSTPADRVIAALAKAAEHVVRRSPAPLGARLDFVNQIEGLKEKFRELERIAWKVDQK